MPKRVYPPQRPKKLNISLDAETVEYLQQLFPTGRGVGRFFSLLALQHLLQRDVETPREPLSTKEQWRKDGICVD